MSGETHEFVGDKFRLWIRPDGIAEITWTPHVPSGIEDARQAVQGMRELTGGRAAPILVHTTDAGPQDRAARMEFIGSQEVVSACALITGNPLSRLMANFFMNVSRPNVPVRMFDNDADAIDWLSGHLD